MTRRSLFQVVAGALAGSLLTGLPLVGAPSVLQTAEPEEVGLHIEDEAEYRWGDSDDIQFSWTVMCHDRRLTGFFHDP